MSYITKTKRFWLPSLALMLSQTPLVQAVEKDGEFVLEPYEIAERMAQHKRQLELNQELRTPLLVTSLDDGIEVTSFENYDEFIEYQGYFNLFGEGTHEITTNGKTKTVVVSLRDLKKKLFLAVVAVNVLEAIRFYVSFACSFSFAERSK